ncbi:MAG: primosomal protein N' [Hyphomicrobiales bacterium]|nr:primosomal protein N' [Hyphomicrobiales bacterium]|tara:strand:- start:9545 stop:11710 length:2166 start_codon:yes stop_codon:yes gene_type:complete
MNNSYNLSILLPTNIGKTYTYSYINKLKIGTIVRVSFSNRESLGVVWNDTDPNNRFDGNKIKPILKEVTSEEGILLPHDLVEFINWVSKYYMMPLGLVLKAALKTNFIEKKINNNFLYKINSNLPAKITAQQFKVLELYNSKEFIDRASISKIANVSSGIISRMIKKEILLPTENIIENTSLINLSNKTTFNNEQTIAVKKIANEINNEKVILIDGVTGSGKTEVYLDAVSKIINTGKQALIMLPEITLTHEFLSDFKSRFKNQIAEWHSSLTEKERKVIWRGVLFGKIKLIIGARSSLFLPFNKLGIIVVDEEHDQSYKQEEGIIYHARDMAVLRAKHSKATCILASATPSIESYENVITGRYERVVIGKRFSGTKMPSIKFIDMRCAEKEKDSFLPKELIRDIEETLNKNEQALLFLNRRGYSPLSICSNCGIRIDCPNCDTWLVYHKKISQYICHYCGHSEYELSKCKNCGLQDTIIPSGRGIERVAEEIGEIFPNINKMIFSSDYLKNTAQIESALRDIKANKVNLIIGTQLVSKGHNFPYLTYVGILDADFGLELTDIRAAERTYQILNQVSGRAGRIRQNSEVKILTHMPDHPIIQSILKNKKDDFYRTEVEMRKNSRMPPFWRLISVIISSQNKVILNEFAEKLYSTRNFPQNINIYGPIEAPVSKLNKRYRMRFLIRGPRNSNIQLYTKRWLENKKVSSQIKIIIDVDPQNFL